MTVVDTTEAASISFQLVVLSRFGLVVRRWAGKQTDLSSIRFGSPFSPKIMVYGQPSCDFAHTVNETLKWLSQLPTLMRSHSGGNSAASGGGGFFFPRLRGFWETIHSPIALLFFLFFLSGD